MLDAQFIGVIQVLVYAGAIMVVFLFVIMLLNLGRAGADRRYARHVWDIVAGGLAIVVLAADDGAAAARRARWSLRVIAPDSLAVEARRDGRRRAASPARSSRNICWRSKSRACCCWSPSSARGAGASGTSVTDAPRRRNRGPRGRACSLNRSLFSAVLFAIGVVGVLTRRNAIIMFMCVELMLNAVNLTFVAFSQALRRTRGRCSWCS